jgi:hypothetical protein
VQANFLKQFFSVSWLCKLFDKASVKALARVALAMCLQMRWLLAKLVIFTFSKSFS